MTNSTHPSDPKDLFPAMQDDDFDLNEPPGDLGNELDPSDSEPEPEPASEPEPEPEPESEPRIPKSRFDEINERRKAAEAKLRELEQKLNEKKPEVDFDFAAKEKEYMEAVLDGDTEKALAIREEIRAAERRQFELELEQRTSQAVALSKAEIELKETIEAAQSAYPVFNAESDQYSPELTEEALDLFEAFKARGYEPADAMRRAVRYVVKANGLDARAGKPGAPNRKPAAPSRDQVQKKLETAAQQPPAPDVNRNEEPVPNIFTMSEEEFDRLSEAELRRLRGDMIG